MRRAIAARMHESITSIPSYDIEDEAYGAAFMASLKEYIENPILML